MATACIRTSVYNSAQVSPRYEALFKVSDCLRAHRDLRELFRILPGQLCSVLDFDYMSIFLNREFPAGGCWYVLDDEDPSTLTSARDMPLEQACVSWAFEHQQPVMIPALHEEPRFSSANRLLNDRGLQFGCAVPMNAVNRRLGAMFLGSERSRPRSDEEVHFMSFVADRVAVVIDDMLSRGPRYGNGPSDHLDKENLALSREIAPAAMFEEIAGSSDKLKRVLGNVTRVAPTDATVLITGESGTGKELVARAIHKRSRRSSRPFVRVNCAAIPPSLIASELFGYEKGAFTGAAQRHLGRFEVANGGTIFLDEIGDIPAETQIALLRVLQEREFERVGGTRPIPIDVRVLAATHCDLRAAIAEGKFRRDLFYRLNVFPLQIPPLRERPEDIPLLATHFVQRYANKAGKKIRSIERQTLEWLQDYDWPGNIRELQNVVERAVILCDGDTFSIEKTWLHPEPRMAPNRPFLLSESLVNQEKEIIETALEESRGRISGPVGAAEKLGMPRTTLESKIKSMGINKHYFKSA